MELQDYQGIRSMKIEKNFMRIGKQTYFENKMIMKGLKLIMEENKCCHLQKGRDCWTEGFR